jgi:hypothetical protein
MTLPLYIAAERVSCTPNPLDRSLLVGVGFANLSSLALELDQYGYTQEDDVQIFKCVPVAPEEEKSMWADVEARKNVCKHGLPMPGHPDYGPETVCVNCLAENEWLEAGDRAYDLRRGN